MGDATFFRCRECGYEFLSKTPNSPCPKCKSPRLEQRDLKALSGFDD